MARVYQSWGRYPSAKHEVELLRWRTDPLPLEKHDGKPVLAYGNGRSYGDSCLNDGGVLIDVRPLDHMIHFDRDRGVLRCEAGVTLDQILEISIPSGWFLSVTPGTQFVTVGGAIANDVHGKNHHRAGAFGNHIRCFELARSDGRNEHCWPEANPGLFAATIGGLGLTGVIRWAEIQLKRVESAVVDVETIPMRDFDHFLDLSAQSDATHEYTVAWVDCLAPAHATGRGVFMRANHSTTGSERANRAIRSWLRVPFALPISPLNSVTLKAFNTIYYHSRRRRSRPQGTGFFYPLDSIQDWNVLYGRRGFLQYQCVVPDADAVRALLSRIAKARIGSFLAVLNVFGDIPSRGLMSFARPGVTLALDFPRQEQSTFDLLDELDVIVGEAHGAVYPAKDARMKAESFRGFFPQWQEFSKFVDPRFSSSFWRRVMSRADE